MSGGPEPHGQIDEVVAHELALAELRRQLVYVRWPVELALNRNRRILISLRGSRWRGMRLSIHRELLRHPAALADLPRWVAAGGRTRSPAISAALDAAGRTLRARERVAHPPLVLEALGGPLALDTAFARIHAEWFPHLAKPAVSWGRAARQARRHVRFAMYRRSPTPQVVVNRRLDQAWVAREFVDFVLYHELCHHAQACAPLRGETAHSARFRAWERRYPRFDEILRWERENLDRFLDRASPA